MILLVCYLLPAGDEFAERGERFAESYAAHPPGLAHHVLVILKGHDRAPEWCRPDWPVIVHDNEGLDIGSLQRVARAHPGADHLMWLGAYSRILAHDWLAKFHAAATLGGIGAVAATGSFEAGVSGQRPNPHLRTGALMISPALLNSLGYPPLQTRGHTYEFEHGNDSLYRRLRAHSLEGVVIGASGRVYREHEWATSSTFRNGDQADLIIADKQSDAYAAAGPDERLALARMAGWEP